METRATSSTTTQQHRWRRGTTFAIALVCLLAALTGSGPASAAQTWTVTDPADSGPGTLRQALGDAAPGDLIVFDPSLAGATVALTSGQLLIDKDLVIDGGDAPGVTVSGSNLSRVFLVEAGVEAEIRSLVIAEGRTLDAAVGEDAEGGGGIRNLGTLRLKECIVRDNRTGNGGDGPPGVLGTAWDPGGNGGDGGGIFNMGALTMELTLIADNETGHGGDACQGCQMYIDTGRGGDGGLGGGIYSNGVLTATGSIVRGNLTGRHGGGIPDGNPGDGGGIYGTGELMITATEIISNTTADGGARGGRSGHGGGAFAQGDVTISDSVIGHNATGTAYEGGDGAGVFASGTLTMVDSSVEYNTAGPGGWGFSLFPPYSSTPGGPGGDGGGICFVGGDLRVVRSVIAHNTGGDGGHGGGALGETFRRYGGNGGSGGDGGGILATGYATIALTATVLTGNSAGAGGEAGLGYISSGRGGDGGRGGGILTWGGGSVVVLNTAISHNRAGNANPACDSSRQPPCGSGGDGGGIYNYGPLAIHNSTVSGNLSGESLGQIGRGGGLFNAGSTVVRSSTFAGNAVPPQGSGGGLWTSGAVMLQDTLLASNMSGTVAADCYGVVMLLSHNLVERTAGCSLVGDPQSNILDRPALIGPLALNAPGTNETHASLPDSPAIDAGSCSGGLITTDQRGVPRPQGAACDIGAYELDPAAVGWRPVYLPFVVGE